MDTDPSFDAQSADAELDALLRRIDASVEERIRNAADLDAGLADVEDEAAWRRRHAAELHDGPTGLESEAARRRRGTPVATEDISRLIAHLELIDGAPGQ